MKNTEKYLLFSFFAFLISISVLLSCTKNKDSALLINNINSILELHPDSAQKILDSIQNPEKYGKEFHNQYLLFQIRINKVLEENINIKNIDSLYTNLNKVHRSEATSSSVANQVYALKIKSIYEESKGNLIGALQYQREHEKLIEKTYEEASATSLIAIQKKYNKEQIKNIESETFIKSQYFIIVLLVSVLVIVLILFIYYKLHTKHKESLLFKEQKIIQLEKLLSKKEPLGEEGEENSQNNLQNFFNILIEIALLEKNLWGDEKKYAQKTFKKINDIIYGNSSLEWEKLYRLMNDIHDGFLNKFKERYHVLSESEFRICCLTFFGLNNTDIASVLNFTVNTIQAKKTIIRKDLSMEKYQNIKEFMESCKQAGIPIP